MSTEVDFQDDWGSRKIFLAAMLTQTLGTNTIILLPQQAVLYGAAGHIAAYAVIYIFIGIPLLYMEYVTGQFTGRNCLDVWKARPCLSHVAYVQIFWQIMHVILNHSFGCFVVHYFLISFENPIPYYMCASWTNKDCNILDQNYTIHQDCLTLNDRLPYCSQLCTTFPEFQYWRYYILGLNKDSFYVAWRVTLASGIICIFLIFSCFRRIESIKWMLGICVTFIISARLLFLIGSMLQKGVVVKFEDAVDADFTLFPKFVAISECVVEVLFSLNLGTGISFNLASRSSVRSPCYSNTVIVVVVTAAITIIGICSNAMMLCPYSFKHNVRPHAISKYPIFIIYEMVPRLLFIYESKSFWLILCYSLAAISFFSVNTIIISSLIDILSRRYTAVANCPGIISVAVVGALYILSIPLLGNKTLFFMAELQRGINFLPIFVVLIECFVFLIFYGLGRFSEDVHFMLGIQPNAFVKTSWIVCIFALIYVFCAKLYVIYSNRRRSVGTETGFWLLIIIMTLTMLVAIVRISRAFYKKKINDEIALDPTWGPRSEVLQRSRAMFTTHAMTKEYIYRQYHLQAGILMRQRSCNIRN